MAQDIQSNTFSEAAGRGNATILQSPSFTDKINNLITINREIRYAQDVAKKQKQADINQLNVDYSKGVWTQDALELKKRQKEFSDKWVNIYKNRETPRGYELTSAEQIDLQREQAELAQFADMVNTQKDAVNNMSKELYSKAGEYDVTDWNNFLQQQAKLPPEQRTYELYEPKPNKEEKPFIGKINPVTRKTSYENVDPNNPYATNTNFGTRIDPDASYSNVIDFVFSAAANNVPGASRELNILYQLTGATTPDGIKKYLKDNKSDEKYSYVQSLVNARLNPVETESGTKIGTAPTNKDAGKFNSGSEWMSAKGIGVGFGNKTGIIGYNEDGTPKYGDVGGYYVSLSSDPLTIRGISSTRNLSTGKKETGATGITYDSGADIVYRTFSSGDQFKSGWYVSGNVWDGEKEVVKEAELNETIFWSILKQRGVLDAKNPKQAAMDVIDELEATRPNSNEVKILRDWVNKGNVAQYSRGSKTSTSSSSSGQSTPNVVDVSNLFK